MEDAVEKGASGHYQITSRFRMHAVRFENWTVDERIYEAFPETRERISITSQRSDKADGDSIVNGGP